MSLTIDSFERRCRLCAEVQDVAIMIFSDEAETMFLKKKLNKYLLIEVEEDDKLPKNICIKCCSKLQIVCDFIDTAIKSQETLHKHSLVLEHSEKKTSFNVKEEVQSDDDINTPMEVNVDPMMVLQNSEDAISPVEETCESDIQIVTHLHGLDGEDVTLKLIKKGDKIDTTNAVDNDSDIKPYGCYTCQRHFFTEFGLKKHALVHKADKEMKPFKCAACREQFNLKYELIEHLKKHTSPGICKLCGRRFRNEVNLAAHMVSHNTDNVRTFSCKVCGRSYNSSSNLKTHSITHSFERPYKCQYCKKCFKRKQDLKFHINQHTGEKPFKCPFCDKCFASSGNCYSHKSRMHPTERSDVKIRKRPTVSRENQPLQFRPIAPKPVVSPLKFNMKYQCTLCNHSFLKRDNLTYHMYQHTGEKPFHCSFCSEKFVTRRGLLLHHDNTHPGKDRPLALLSRNALLK